MARVVFSSPPRLLLFYGVEKWFKPETNLKRFLDLLVHFCAKEAAAPVCVLPSPHHCWKRREMHRAVPAAFHSLLLSFPQDLTSQGRVPGLCPNLAPAIVGMWMDVCVRERECVCVSIRVCAHMHRCKGVAVAPCSDLRQFDSALGVCTVTHVIVMISLLTVTFLSNVWINNT